jgi:hypothetical protein
MRKCKLFFIVPFIFCCVSSYADPVLYSQDAEATTYTPDISTKQSLKYDADISPYKELKQITGGEDFGKKKESWSLRFKQDITQAEQDDNVNSAWLRMFRNITAHILRILVVLSVITLLIALIIIIRKTKSGIKKKGKYSSESLKPNTELSAPELLNQSLDTFNTGNTREAWALCLAATIKAFAGKQIVFKPNATEYESYNVVKQKHPQYAQSYLQIIKDWINIAYANIKLQKENFDNAVLFCQKLIAEESKNEN